MQNIRLQILYNRGTAFKGGEYMQVDARLQGNVLVVRLCGEMDEHSAKLARAKADKLAETYARSERVVFDLGGVSFMDSTGIGFLIGRYKKFHRFGVPTYITGVGAETDRILQMSGVYSLMPKV